MHPSPYERFLSYVYTDSVKFNWRLTNITLPLQLLIYKLRSKIEVNKK